MSTAKLKKDVLKHLQAKPLSLAELAVVMGLKEKRVFRLLRSLFEGSEIAPLRGPDGARKYRTTTEEEKETARKAKEGDEEIADDKDEEEDE